jgi:uncharacterized protein (UPF0335 family)
MAKTLRSEVPDQFGGVINETALARYVERVERLHEERASLGEDIKAVMEEAKNAGFVPKIIRQMVRERKMEPVELQDHLALLDSYRRGLGMLAGTPLGDAAMDRAEAETGSARAEGASRRGRKPRSFDEQPVHQPRPRGRPRKNVGEALADARLHLGEEEPAGTA